VKVLITGSRGWANQRVIYQAYYGPLTELAQVLGSKPRFCRFDSYMAQVRLQPMGPFYV
jgi:hypothetical protein